MTLAKPPFLGFFPLFFLIFFLSCFLFVAQRLSVRSLSAVTSPVVDQGTYLDMAVAYVYDGDTIRLVNGEKVRFIGIDAPESSENKKLFRDATRSGRDVKVVLRMGRKAADYTRALLQGHRVRLEFDIETHDKYGRLLAYVYRVEDGLFINAKIISDGYAYPMAIPPNIRYAETFRKLFHEARTSGRGLWAGL